MNHHRKHKPLFAAFAAVVKLPALIALVVLGTTTPLRAQPPATPPGASGAPQGEHMEAARKLHGEFMQLQQKLASIQQQAIKTHPELQKQQEELEALVTSKMTAAGLDASGEMEAINAIETQLRNPDTPDSERQKLMPEYQQRAKAFRDAQMQVLKDPEVEKARTALVDATTAAMKQEDPQVEQLLEQLKQKQAEMQKLIQQAPPPPGK
jgi:hypothetical protein